MQCMLFACVCGQDGDNIERKMARKGKGDTRVCITQMERMEGKRREGGREGGERARTWPGNVNTAYSVTRLTAS